MIHERISKQVFIKKGDNSLNKLEYLEISNANLIHIINEEVAII